MQAQAAQYSSHFAALQNASGSGDLKSAREALRDFQKDSATATVNGYDPVNQSASLRQAFASVRKALAGGDMSTAKTAMASVVQGLSATNGGSVAVKLGSDLQSLETAVKAGNLESASQALRTFGKDSALAFSKEIAAAASATDSGSPAQVAAARMISDIRSLQVALKSGDPRKASSTYVKLQPELKSFTQAPQVFPTAAAAAYTLPPTVTNAKQAVLQGLAAKL
jgi:hypothetical protein